MEIEDGEPEIVLPLVAGAFAHWRQRRGPRRMPSRRDIDAVELRGCLPHVWLCDYDRTSDRFRYRVSGEAINETYGRNLAGSFLDELFPVEERSRVMRRYAPIIREGAVVHALGWLYETNRRAITGERLVMPLSDDGETLDGILGVTIPSGLGMSIPPSDDAGERVIRRCFRIPRDETS